MQLLFTYMFANSKVLVYSSNHLSNVEIVTNDLNNHKIIMNLLKTTSLFGLFVEENQRWIT